MRLHVKHKRFKLGQYELSIGNPASPPVVWWVSLERTKPTCISAGRQHYSSKPLFRLQYQKLPITIHHIHDRWAWVRVV